MAPQPLKRQVEKDLERKYGYAHTTEMINRMQKHKVDFIALIIVTEGAWESCSDSIRI